MGWQIASVGLGGAIGAVIRYALLQWLGGVDDGILPWGTVSANLLGSLLLGMVVGLFDRGALREPARLFLAVGLLGGFTTFSLFSYENLELLRDGRYLVLLVNAIGQTVLGLCGAAAGHFLIPRLRHSRLN
ncbi:MAG: fluoride efflux transporter CrcB [Thermomicrobiaceae bacterium]